jgi:hypothetical protein
MDTGVSTSASDSQSFCTPPHAEETPASSKPSAFDNGPAIHDFEAKSFKRGHFPAARCQQYHPLDAKVFKYLCADAVIAVAR